MPDARAHGGFVNAKNNLKRVHQKQPYKLVDDDNDNCIANSDPLGHEESACSNILDLAPISATDSLIVATVIYLRYSRG